MKITTLQAEGDTLALTLMDALKRDSSSQCRLAPVEDLSVNHDEANYLYLPSLADSDGMIPNLVQAERVFQHLARLGGARIVIVSSALIYGTGPARQALVTETYSMQQKPSDKICATWRSLENLAFRYLSGRMQMTVLRPVTILPSESLLGRLLRQRIVPTLPGHDANLQLLSPGDLAQAIRCAFSSDQSGVFNVAPDHTVPMHRALRVAQRRRLPIPRTLQRLARRAEALDYIRYSWTVSNEKIKRELGFVPSRTSLMAFLEASRHPEAGAGREPFFDPFGMDRDYIEFYGKTLFKFLSDCYWRIEVRGIEQVPRQGPGVLAGMHRGFMPFDGVMALHLLARKIGRYPRFLVHPALLKFPFLANFMTKLGGIVACHEHADRILENGELVGIFPEGINGAFTPYRDSYKLKPFGRDAFVKMALHHRAPIVPFVTVGSAEIFPILGKIESKIWNRYAGWPFIPLTPTFPFLPLPLPSKWHTRFLAPVHVEKLYPPEAAQDRSVVKAISLDIRRRMQQAVDDMLLRRRSIFFGSVFEPEDNL